MKQICKSLDNRQVVSKETGLTSQQEKGAMLLASGSKIDDVCQVLQIGRATLYRWRRRESFQCFYNLITQDIKTYVETSIMELHADALQAIKDSLQSDNEAIKLKSAMWILDKVASVDIGETNYRKILKAQVIENQKETWRVHSIDKDYQKLLSQEGMSE